MKDKIKKIKDKAKGVSDKLGFRVQSKRPIMQTQGVMIAGTLSGALTGALMGRPSLYSGIATTILGCVTKIPVVTSFGIGMTAAGGYQAFNTVSGTGMQGVKDRLKAIGEDYKYRLYLDKIIKPTEEAAVSGTRNVQYFKYPLRGTTPLDMSAVEKIQMELAQSALQFKQSNSQQVNGIYENTDFENKLY